MNRKAMIEIIQCSKCGEDFEATHDDLGTYWHESCKVKNTITYNDLIELLEKLCRE
jgi:hypothetical protein